MLPDRVPPNTILLVWLDFFAYLTGEVGEIEARGKIYTTGAVLSYESHGHLSIYAEIRSSRNQRFWDRRLAQCGVFRLPPYINRSIWSFTDAYRLETPSTTGYVRSLVLWSPWELRAHLYSRVKDPKMWKNYGGVANPGFFFGFCAGEPLPDFIFQCQRGDFSLIYLLKAATPPYVSIKLF